MTICVNCKYFICKGNIWYRQFCGAPKVQGKKEVNPVTGEVGYVKENDLGRTYYSNMASPNARDINDGNCEYFEGKLPDTPVLGKIDKSEKETRVLVGFWDEIVERQN